MIESEALSKQYYRARYNILGKYTVLVIGKVLFKV